MKFADTILEMRDLNVIFPTSDGDVRAVDRVGLRISAGETFGLIGESGSGKTVLGMAALRLLPSYARVGGEILFGGRDLLLLDEEDMRQVRGGEIAMVLQNTATSLNPVVSVGDQIAWAVGLHRGLCRDAAREEAVRMLDAVRIPEPVRRAKEYPHQFSGGMRERAMIALALACDPSFIIADEPTAGLDAAVKWEVVEILKRTFADRGMLFVTHDLEVAAEVSDRIGVMYAGELVECGPADLLLCDPLHPYTAALLASLPEGGFVPIPGVSPSLISPPVGCRFHPRCHRAGPACRAAHPEMREYGEGRFVRCLLYD